MQRLLSQYVKRRGMHWRKFDHVNWLCASTFDLIDHACQFDLWSRYEVTVDIAPELKWTPEEGYKNLKVAVELDSDIDAQKASEQELRRRHKSLGALRIVTDRGLQVTQVQFTFVLFFWIKCYFNDMFIRCWDKFCQTLHENS